MADASFKDVPELFEVRMHPSTYSENSVNRCRLTSESL